MTYTYPERQRRDRRQGPGGTACRTLLDQHVSISSVSITMNMIISISIIIIISSNSSIITIHVCYSKVVNNAAKSISSIRQVVPQKTNEAALDKQR